MVYVPRKLTWQERCVQVHEFYIQNLKVNHLWSVRDCAKALTMSTGSVSEYLQLAEYLRAYPKELGEIKNYVDARCWIADKKKYLRQRG